MELLPFFQIMKRYLPFPCTVKTIPFRKEKSDGILLYLTKHIDATYMKILADSLDDLYQNVQPDFVFYLSGVDVITGQARKIGLVGIRL